MERLSPDLLGSPLAAGHECRYRLAAGYTMPADVVLDAACGVGYGAAFARDVEWVGVDQADVIDPAFVPFGRWLVEDLSTWRPDFAFDVGVSFETIEHVANPAFLVGSLCLARRLVICSVPTVPTRTANPHHLHDFTMWELPRMFEAHGFGLVECLLQPAELSTIYVFGR